jgi:NitT/TauT family transport system substrate-binding protein
MPPSRPRPALRAAILALGMAVVACTTGSSAGTSPGASAGSVGCGGSSGCTELKVGLGYLGSVQFAPFYLAQEAGYYAAAGLSVAFQNQIDPNLVTLVGQGAIDIGVADGTSVIPAVSQGIPIRYVATIYGTFPSIVFAKASSGIRTAADLKGRKLGIPGRYGSSWVMLQALLSSVHLTPDDVTIVEYPEFGQGVALQQGAVDAATGFANNEPVQLERSGTKAVVLHVDNVIALPGPGLIAGTATLTSKEAAIRAFVAATLRAMNEITTNPSKGVDAAIAAVPELAQDRALQEAILKATIETWRSPRTDTQGLGAIDEAGWSASIEYLTQLKLVAGPVTLDQLVRTDLLPTPVGAGPS